MDLDSPAGRQLCADDGQPTGLFDSSVVGIFVLSPDNRYLRVSRRWCEMLGYTEQELLGLHPAAITQAKGHEVEVVTARRLAEGNADPLHLEECYLRKDGSVLHAEVMMVAICDTEGRHRATLGMAVDAAHHPGALARLRESQARYDSLVRNSWDMVWHMDLDGRLISVNSLCRDLLGYEPEELQGQPIAIVLADSERARVDEWLDSLRSSEVPPVFTQELLHRRKDGSTFVGELRAMLVWNDVGDLVEVQGVTRDVSTRGVTEERLRQGVDSERQFRSKLIALHEMTIALASATSRADVCRRAVQFAHEHLGYARLSVWFLDEERERITGSFGIDESGHVRDERSRSHPIPADGTLRRLEREQGRWTMTGPGPLLDDSGNVVGEGWRVSAPLWDGEQVIGIVYADTLGIDRPYTDQEGELLVLFASAVGHLYTRLAVEEQLRASEHRYRAVVNDQAEYIARYSPEGIIVFANPAFASLVGRPAAQLVGTPIADVMGDQAWDRIPWAGDPDQDPSATFLVTEREWTAGPGTPRWIRWSRRALADASGYVVEYQVVGVDLTAQRQMDADLRVRQNAIDAALHGIAILDEGGHLTYANRAHVTMFGYERQNDLIGRHLSELYDPPTVAESLVEELHRQGTWTGELKGLRRGGGVFDARVSASLIKQPGGGSICLLTWVEDVTEPNRAREEQERLSAHLRQMQQVETLGVLIGGVAHDLNNIIMGAIGGAQLALMQLPEDSEARPLVEQVESSAWRAANLAQQMLTYAGRGRASTEPTDISAIVRGMADLIESSVSKKVRLIYDLATPLPAIVGDPVQVEQVVMNLVLNAYEALPARSGTITVRTGLRRFGGAELDANFLPTPLEPGPYVFLQVQDTGRGMDPPTMARVFEPFFTTKRAGCGLGLPAVLAIVRGHGGAIAVESTPGEGTCFTVVFPCAPITLQSVPTKRPRALPVASEGHSAVVLLADDDDVVRANAQAALEIAGYTVLLAADGSEVLEVFRRHQHSIDILLVDMMMPGLSGDEVCAAIQKLRPDLPIILCSGYDEQVMETSLLPAPESVTFLQKPYSLSELVHSVTGCLTRCR